MPSLNCLCQCIMYYWFLCIQHNASIMFLFYQLLLSRHCINKSQYLQESGVPGSCEWRFRNCFADREIILWPVSECGILCRPLYTLTSHSYNRTAIMTKTLHSFSRTSCQLISRLNVDSQECHHLSLPWNDKLRW